MGRDRERTLRRSGPRGQLRDEGGRRGGAGLRHRDFGYPNADKILAEKHITLKRGDGHILLADCGSATDLMEVWSRANEKICFRVTGTKGYLTLEIPAVFAVKGNAYSAKVDMTVARRRRRSTSTRTPGRRSARAPTNRAATSCSWRSAPASSTGDARTGPTAASCGRPYRAIGTAPLNPSAE